MTFLGFGALPYGFWILIDEASGGTVEVSKVDFPYLFIGLVGPYTCGFVTLFLLF